MVLSNYIGSYLTARSDVIFSEKQEALLNAPSGDMHVAAIIAAGGRGRRIGGEKPKQFQTLGDRSLLSWAVRPFSLSSRIREIVVVLPHDELSTSLDSFANGGTVVKFVEGGRRRQDSVAAGLEEVASGTDIVVVHDGARPFCTEALIDRMIDAAAEFGAAIPAVPVKETVKDIEPIEGRMFVRQTVPRDGLYLAQTPQAFRLDVLAAAVALGQSGLDSTDEAMLAERAGYPVCVVDGDELNMKITTPENMRVAEQIVAGRTPPPKIGFGYDCHRLVTGRKLVLGGIEIPHRSGLLGHSDADVVCHAVIDAMLGAGAAGDIGQLFPDDDPRWKGASSIDLLRETVSLLRTKGLTVGNVDIVVIAEEPKLSPFSKEITSRLAAVLQVGPSQVNIKAKTAEGLGEIGRGEAISVQAIALMIEVRP